MPWRLLLFTALLASTGFTRHGLAEAPRLLFLIGEQEYDTRRSLPEFAKKELAPLGFSLRFVHAATDDRSKPACHDFPGLADALDRADLLVLSTRRRFPKAEQLERLRRWIGSGGPVVGLRTASHAFAARKSGDVPPGRSAWQNFDREVLGARYRGHYNNKPSEGKPATQVWVALGARRNPLLDGVAWEGRRTVRSHLYKMHDLGSSATVLLQGQLPGHERVEPVAWAYPRKPGRTFYTSLGSAEDMKDPAVRRLLVNAIRWALGDRQPQQPSQRGSDQTDG